MRLLRDWRLPEEYPTDRGGQDDYERRVRRWQRALYLPMILLILAPAAAGWWATGPAVARFVVRRQIEQPDRQAHRPPPPQIPAPSAGPARS